MWIFVAFSGSSDSSPYYIKDHLSPSDVKDRGLFHILNAMEVSDASGKRPLLEYLWPETNTNSQENFRKYSKDDPYYSGTEG